jgi:hypothetical protein
VNETGIERVAGENARAGRVSADVEGDLADEDFAVGEGREFARSGQREPRIALILRLTVISGAGNSEQTNARPRLIKTKEAAESRSRRVASSGSGAHGSKAPGIDAPA